MAKAKRKKNDLFPLGMLSSLQALANKSFERYFKRAYLQAIRRQPDNEGLIKNLFVSSVDSLLTLKRTQLAKLTTYTRESPQKNNMMILNDKLCSYKSGQPTKALSTMLLKILARELISREEASRPFWTTAFRELSATLPLPIATDCRGLHSTSSNPSLTKLVEQSPLLRIQETSLPNKNSPKTSSLSSISTHVDKWVSAHTPNESKLMKTVVLQFHPTPEQKTLLDRDLQTSNFVYNKVVEYINVSQRAKYSKLTLRDMFVTENSRKGNTLFAKVSSAKARIERMINDLKRTRSLRDAVKAVMIKRKHWSRVKVWYDSLKTTCPPEHNGRLKTFETNTHKDIRAGSVFEAHKNFENCVDAVKAGRIKFFRLKYRSKKSHGMSMVITTAMLKLQNGILRFTNRDMVDKTIRVANRTRKVLQGISTLKDSKITKQNGVYRLHIPVEVSPATPNSFERVIGIDPGVSTFLSGYTPDKIVLVQQSDCVKRIDRLRKRLRKLRKDKARKRLRRRTMLKLERRQANLTNELHWKSVNYLVKNYDVIFLEKFDSQGFVKGGKSKQLNRDTNNLKPYQFRQRLLYKAFTHGKLVEVVNARYTTMTCSNCGNVQRMTLADRVYKCSGCALTLDRDFNAGKNILLKGLLC